MKIAAKIFFYLLPFTILALSFPLYFNKEISACSSPRTYSIGSVDLNFGISEEEFRRAAGEAASKWNNVYQNNLLAYSPKGSISVNLVFDERQATLARINMSEGRVKEEKGLVDQSFSNYEARVVDFEKKLVQLNSEIENWNKQGGAPQEIYEDLITRQKTLRQEANQLNENAKDTNNQAKNFNAEVEDLNREVSLFNRILEHKPEGGIYMSGEEKIEVYIASDTDELVRVLAHEMGHALGLDHVNDIDSIMFPLSSTADSLSSADIKALQVVCMPVKKSDIVFDRLRDSLIFIKNI